MNDVAVQSDTDIIALKGVRGMIAAKMLKSLSESAQLTHHAEADASGLFERKRIAQQDGIKLSIEDMLMEIVCKVLKKHPHMNGSVTKNKIHLSKKVNLSIAMAMPGNLLVAPAIFDADKLDLAALREARTELSQRAKTNKLSVPEMTKGTFTISNLGLSRVQFFTPILNTPQIAILGIGCITQKVVIVEDGSIVSKPFMGLSLTFDHRAVDGAPAANFLSDICEAIEVQ